MALLVQKFGGSSVGSLEKIRALATRLAARRALSDDLVVVVSAMQGETDRLLGLAREVASRPDPRELDQLVATGEQVAAALLALALRDRGVAACSLTGAQLRLHTDGAYAHARIRSLDCAPVRAQLQLGAVVVATGFQGVDVAGNLTTLGRGGSDTSAVALAAALGAAECEIYTDVLGVYTADPRICPAARKLDRISFDEMMEMASLGSKVLQIRSVELAMNHNLPLRVRSAVSDDPGTRVEGVSDALERVNVCGISHAPHEARLTLRRLPDRPGIAAEIFTRLAVAQINVDVIVQNSATDGLTDISFTVARAQCEAALELLQGPGGETMTVEVDRAIGKVSIVGVGMMSHPGVAATMFSALAAANINILIITTSEIKVTCVVAETDTVAAVQVLHAAFHLERPAATPLLAAASA